MIHGIIVSLSNGLLQQAGMGTGRKQELKLQANTIYGGLVGSFGIHVSKSTWQTSLFFLVSRWASLTLGKWWDV